MVDWYDPATWQTGVKTAAGLAKLYDSLRKKMGRKVDTGPRPRNRRGNVPRVEDAEARRRLDALGRTLEEALKLSVQSARNDAKAWATVVRLANVVDKNARRLAALEKAASMKKPRKPVKRKRRS